MLQLRAAEGAIAQAEVFVDGVDRLASALAAAAGRFRRRWTRRRRRSRRHGSGWPRVRSRGCPPVRWRGMSAAPRPRWPPYGKRPPPGRTTRWRPCAGSLACASARRGGARAPTGSSRARPPPPRTTSSARTGARWAPRPRTRLAEARRLLGRDPVGGRRLAREARQLAERDVRAHGHPYGGRPEHANGVAGAVLGGILLGDPPDAGVDTLTGGAPGSFGGPATRARRGVAS